MIGKTIQIDGVDLLVLDMIDDNPLVWAYNLNTDVRFSNESNNYMKSDLRKAAERWLKGTKFAVIPRTLDLLTMDGYRGYGVHNVDIAPLTIDEYRKYAEIIIPHIKDYFWLATGWGRPDGSGWAATGVCAVTAGGTAGSNDYDGSLSLAPAFILDRSHLEKQKKNEQLAYFSNEELAQELVRRFMKDK